MRQYWGKYRGSVVDNEDPLMLGRLQVSVPQILGEVSSAWAMPCLPYAGQEVGFCMMPPIGAALWVEFEGGDPDYPIWTGCYWREGERPIAAEGPSMKVIRTDSCQLLLDDTPGAGGFSLSVTEPAVPMPITLKASGEGVSIRLGEIGISVTPSGVVVSAEPAVLAVEVAGVRLEHGSARIGAVQPRICVSEPVVTVPGGT